MQRRFSYLIVGILLAVSCGKTPQDVGVLSEDAVIFAVCGPLTVEIGTRASLPLPGANFATLANSGIGISAAYLASGTFSESSTPVNYFTNRQLIRGDDKGIGSGMVSRPTGLDINAWELNPGGLWPYDGKLSFFAYAPYREETEDNFEIPGFVSPYSSGYPRLFFRPDPDPKNQVDLLTGMTLNQERASIQSTYTNDVQYVDLDLSHSLTWVDFQAKVAIDAIFQGNKTNLDTWLETNGLSGCKIFVAGIKISGVLGANSGGWTSEGFVWDTPDFATAERAEYELTIEDGTLHGPDITIDASLWKDLRYDNSLVAVGAETDNYTTIVLQSATTPPTPDGVLYLLPQTLPNGANGAKLTVDYGMYKSRTGTVEDGEELVGVTIWEPHLMYQTEFNISEDALGNEKGIWKPGNHVVYRLELDITKASNSTVTALMVPWTAANNNYSHNGYLE